MNTKSHKSNSLAEISTIFGMTLLLTLFGVFVYFMWTANKKSSEIKEQLSLDILFHESVDESIVRMMEKKLISMEGIVKKALFVSKDDAQKIMLKHVGKDAFEILDGVNPLPSSIHVNLSADYVNPDSASSFALKVLKGNEHIISEVSYNESQFLEIGTVFKNFEFIMLFIAAVLLIIAILLIYNTIRLAVFSKRFMIRTMQLVGAKSYFIRKPFIIRAFYQGLISSLLAVIFLLSLWYSFTYINPNIITELSSDNTVLNQEIFDFSLLASGILLTGILISIISTYFALNKFIWVKSEKLY
jgi:cell division transport system permease protein|tara:strand:+ start:2607 stop:3509 length:903 start_codon:yes stop_codon:yes gene_type:complete